MHGWEEIPGASPFLRSITGAVIPTALNLSAV
jgi:hypothetical protein